MAVLCGTSVNEAIQSRGCGFSRTMDHADPETLVAEYVKRDANGEFMMMDLWFDTATLCPHHETVPDRASVISDSKITRASKTDSVAEFEVTYQISGALVPMAGKNAGRKMFAPGAIEKKRKIIVAKTPFGWRILNPVLADGQFVSAKSALHAGLVRTEDRKTLEGLIK